LAVSFWLLGCQGSDRRRPPWKSGVAGFHLQAAIIGRDMGDARLTTGEIRLAGDDRRDGTT
jgi:hypothetical protein